MLGRDLMALLAAHGVPAKGWDLPDFDLTDEKQLATALNDASAVINCAAYTNVDGAESNKELAFRVNGLAAGTLGQLCAKRNLHVVHVSTDFVFDGRKDGAYSEKDDPCPINVYGASKLAGEIALADSGCSHTIVRVEWTYGIHGPSNFVYKLAQRALTTPALKMVDDQFGSPTPTTFIARCLLSASRQGLQGIYHLAADGHASRFDIARFILDELELKNELVSCQTSDFAAPAERPLNSRFDCRKIKSALSIDTEPVHIEHWQHYLRHYLQTHKEQLL